MNGRPNTRVTLTMALVLATTMALAAARSARESPQSARPTTAPNEEDGGRAVEDTAPGRAGLRVYLDPETGELRSRPSDHGLDQELEEGRPSAADWLNTYGGDLLQERVPQGGYMVDLRGRFQSSVVAAIDPDTDEVETDCLAGPARDEATDEN